MKYLLLTFIGVTMMFNSMAQDKVLTMEEAILGYNLHPKNMFVQWKADQNVLTYIEGTNLVGENAADGKKEVLLTLEDLNRILNTSLRGMPQFSWKDANNIIIARLGKIFAIDVVKKEISHVYKLADGAQNITPNGKELVAYTKDNNLYYLDANNNEYAVTADKDLNIVNGQTVSRNEFGISGGIFWSPDGKQLAFYRKDESLVGTFPLLDINSRTGSLREIKYPMAGMKSEQISLGVYDIASGKTVFMDVTDFGREQYLTNITWGPKSDFIYIQVLDRAQKHMHLNQYCAKTGQFVKTLLTEANEETYVEPQTPIVFLKNDASKFIYRTNNRDGYFNLYLVEAVTGKILKRLTNVDADVEFIGQDAKYVYYTSAEVSPIDNHLFRVDVKSGKKTQLTKVEGWHNINMSRDKKYFVDNYSSLRVPRVINLVQNDGKIVKELLKAENPVKDYNFGEITMGTVKTADGKFDNYYRLIKPMNFDASKKYPTIVYVYGGPHSQMVKNTWLGELRRWEMYMAQHGYVVFVMDNRGTSNRGAEFEKVIHGQCGQAEMADQMEGIKFLKSLPYVDAERIGVHGWSYGGFMTISLITNYPDVFKVAVAGGPVIDWKWYEVMYGERYMDSPHTNAAGYEKVSLIKKAKDLKGKLLICQGAVDNVVVWEHSLSFIRECIKNNVQVDYFPYPCAEHNVMGKDRIHLMQKVTNYFEDYLK
ncbi:MAG: DPP IV N-terminal domain-containing protein [Odoribacter sp.]|nr:DPP IV N-terminal domain-containing protein [Odoribacter sp.]